jgi:hypothetical protein
MGPGDHAVMLGPAHIDVEDVADELRDGVGPHLDGLEELGNVGGEHLPEERLLITEVRVQPFLARAGRRGDAVDTPTCEPVPGELGACGGQDLFAQL